VVSSLSGLVMIVCARLEANAGLSLA
jgi:hypothetical protein